MIVRTPHREKWLIMSRVGLEDARLSWKARGLLAYLLSKPDNWNVMIAHLVKQAPDGRDSVMSGLRELRQAGYIVSSRSRSETGTFDGWDTEVHEEPVAEVGISEVGKPEFGKPAPNEERVLTMTEVNESLLSNEDVGRVSKPHEPYEAEFEDAWLNYPRKEGKIAAYRAFVARIRAGASPTDLRHAAFNYEKTRRGQDTRYTKLGSTFWGPTEPWLDYLPGGVGMAQVPKTPEEIDAEVAEAFVAMTTMFGEYRDREIPRPVANPLVEALLRQHPLKRWGQMSTEEVKYALQAVAREGGAK